MKAETVRIQAKLPPAPLSRAPVHSLPRTAPQENLPLTLIWLHLRCVSFPLRCFSLPCSYFSALMSECGLQRVNCASGTVEYLCLRLSLHCICAALFNLKCQTLIICSAPQGCVTRGARLNCTSAGPYGHDSSSYCGSQECYDRSQFTWSKVSDLVF